MAQQSAPIGAAPGPRRMYRVWSFVREYSLLLLGGALIGLVWANLDYASYHAIVEHNLWTNDWVGHPHDGHRELTVHYLINDVLMALFFAIAGKEVWEAVILERGSLRGAKALTPLIATAGGMIGPVAVYLLVASMSGAFASLAQGWAVPTATDIAFSYLVGRFVFGAGHPAIRFLLLLAIADDAGGLIILAIFYPQGDLAPAWLLVSLGAAIAAYVFFNYLPRKNGSGVWVRETFGPWPFVLAGVVSWYAFQQAGIHPALGLLPIIPAIPHADNAFGFFAAEEENSTDMLNTIEHALKRPVEFILFFFGLANAGVAFSSMNEATTAVLTGLVIGKPLGIFAFGMLAAYTLKLGLPDGMKPRDLFVLGCVAAIGFTVALFVAGVAFEPGPMQEGAKMGALLSFFAATVAIVAGRVLKVEKVA